jgi:hypothetical protein
MNENSSKSLRVRIFKAKHWFVAGFNGMPDYRRDLLLHRPIRDRPAGNETGGLLGQHEERVADLNFDVLSLVRGMIVREINPKGIFRILPKSFPSFVFSAFLWQTFL